MKIKTLIAIIDYIEFKISEFGKSLLPTIQEIRKKLEKDGDNGIDSAYKSLLVLSCQFNLVVPLHSLLSDLPETLEEKYPLRVAEAFVFKTDEFKKMNLLHLGCFFGALDVVQYLYEIQNVEIDRCSLNGITPLHYLLYGARLSQSEEMDRNYKELLDYLLIEGANTLKRCAVDVIPADYAKRTLAEYSRDNNTIYRFFSPPRLLEKTDLWQYIVSRIDACRERDYMRSFSFFITLGNKYKVASYELFRLKMAVRHYIKFGTLTGDFQSLDEIIYSMNHLSPLHKTMLALLVDDYYHNPKVSENKTRFGNFARTSIKEGSTFLLITLLGTESLLAATSAGLIAAYLKWSSQDSAYWSNRIHGRNNITTRAWQIKLSTKTRDYGEEVLTLRPRIW